MKQIHAQEDTQDQPAGLMLGRLNQRFHKCLDTFTAQVGQAVASGEVPVLLRIDDRLILSVGDSQRVFEINGQLYHALKALAHLPLMAYLLTAVEQGAGKNLAALQAALDEAQAQLDWDALGLGDIAQWRAVLAELLAGKQSPEPGADLFDTVSALQDRCVQLAARDEVAALDKAMQEVRAFLKPPQWSEFHVVVCGGNQPRYKQLSKNFFTRLLQVSEGSPPKAGHRVIYSETCQNLAEAKALVADRLVNGRLAELFLNSPIDLDEDVLGDAGLAAIDELFLRKLTA